MPLCSSCFSAATTLHAYNLPQTKRLTVSLPRHVAATRTKCWICYKFSLWLQEQCPKVYEHWQANSLKVTYYRDGYQKSSVLETQPSYLSSPIFEFDMQASSYYGAEDVLFCSIECRLLTVKEHSTLVSNNPRFECRNTLLNLDMRLIKDWINQCTTTHGQCNQRGSIRWYPTRLIKLDNNGRTMKLVVTEEDSPSGPYATLSHRWSSIEYRKLTSSTIAEFQERIETESLPPAFREAGILAHQLGIHYLWIDSLCIKQDGDLQDWTREAPKMQMVYGHSFLNFAAALSPSTGTVSLFDTEIPYPFLPVPFQANTVMVRQHSLGSRFRKRRVTHFARHKRVYRIRQFHVSVVPKKYYMIDSQMWDFEVEDAQLQTRAWVFQERLLAPRQLHFGTRQLAWECKENLALQLFPKTLPTSSTASPALEAFALALSSHTSDVSPKPFRNAWHDLVHLYSGCQLTKASDRLVAVVGVAQLIADARQDQFVGGLWKSTLITDMVWTAYTDVLTRSVDEGFQASSWSWLSSKEQVHFPNQDEPRGYYAEILSHPTTPRAGRAAHTVEGSITISGIVLPLGDIELDENEVRTFSVADLHFESSIRTWEFGKSHLNLVGSLEENQQVLQRGVFMLPLYYTDTDVYGIAIYRSKNHPEEYKRVGAVKILFLNTYPSYSQAETGWRALTWKPAKQTKSLPYHINIAAAELMGVILEKISRSEQEIVVLN